MNVLQYPHVFEEPVLGNIKGWVMDETTRSSGEDINWKHESGKKKSSDSEMLRTYSTGLLAVCLAGCVLRMITHSLLIYVLHIS